MHRIQARLVDPNVDAIACGCADADLFAKAAVANFVALADKYAHLGEIYQVTDKTRAMAAAGQRFFPV